MRTAAKLIEVNQDCYEQTNWSKMMRRCTYQFVLTNVIVNHAYYADELVEGAMQLRQMEDIVLA